jgi:hypothetical protein
MECVTTWEGARVPYKSGEAHGALVVRAVHVTRPAPLAPVLAFVTGESRSRAPTFHIKSTSFSCDVLRRVRGSLRPLESLWRLGTFHACFPRRVF